MDEMRPSGRVVALVTDMIFATKIRSTGQSLGVAVEIVRSNDACRATNDRAAIDLLIVDMDADCESPSVAIANAVARGTGAPILAYCSHVDRTAADAAKHAGATAVWPRSRFASQMPSVLGDPTMLLSS